METISKNPRLHLGNFIHNFSNSMDMCCKFLPLNKEDCSLSQEEIEKFVKEDCNNFLKTKKGFHYLLMKYPNLSVPQAIDEHVKEALWIDSIV